MGKRFRKLSGWCLGVVLVAACTVLARPVDEPAPPAEPADGAARDAPATKPEPAGYMRVTEDPGRLIALEIAARSFEPSDGNGPTVVLVGVSHIAETELYRNVQVLLDEHDLVLYESVKPRGTGTLAGTNDEQRADGSRASLEFLAAILAAYHDARRQYPAGLDELQAYAADRDPRLGDFLTSARIDSWGRPVDYRREGEDGFHLESLGADGAPGGDGADADVRVTHETGVEPPAGDAEDNLQAELARALGLEFQLEAIDYDRKHFRCSDMSIDELERAFEAKGLDFGPIGGSLAGASLPGKIAIYFLRLVRVADVFFDGAIADALKIVLIEMFSDEAFLSQMLRQFGGEFEEVIIGQRNQVVMDDLKTVLAGDEHLDSVAILYGAAHMPDLAERLDKQLGYRSGGDQWFTAFEVDLDQSVLTPRQLTTLRRMVRQQLRQMQVMAERESAKKAVTD